MLKNTFKWWEICDMQIDNEFIVKIKFTFETMVQAL
jgi:hypothetical protein